jgi:broad specificity phosphatase PhoE
MNSEIDIKSKWIFVKHAIPAMRPELPAREWLLKDEGEFQAKVLSLRLKQFLPFALYSSVEPKASRTAEIVGAYFGVPVTVFPGLEEFDRPALPILTSDEICDLNSVVFRNFNKVVIGQESGADALARFNSAVSRIRIQENGNVVVVCHGTVISLFTSHYNSDVDAFELWKSLSCPSYVVMDGNEYRLDHIVDEI